jgi:hypothetical protein
VGGVQDRDSPLTTGIRFAVVVAWPTDSMGRRSLTTEGAAITAPPRPSRGAGEEEGREEPSRAIQRFWLTRVSSSRV